MKLRYLSFLILGLFIIPITHASVTDLQISPELPEQGDLIQLSVIADPLETVDVSIELERELSVISGNYILRVNDIEIPQLPNRFSVRVYDVLTLDVNALGITLSPTVDNSEGFLQVPDLSPGKRNVKISGYSEPGETTVTCIINAWTQVTMDENGEYHDTYDLGDIPPGEVTAIVGGMRKTVTIYPPDNTPPTITGMNPTGEISASTPTISASYSDFFEIKTNSVAIKLDGTDVSSQSSISNQGFTYIPQPLDNNTNHQVQLSVTDKKGNTATKSWSFNVKLSPLPDTSAPVISNTKPTGVVRSTSTQILASLSDNKRIDPSKVTVSLNQDDITSQAQITQSAITCSLTNLQNNTLYTIQISAADKTGNTGNKHWSFTVQLPSVASTPDSPVTAPNLLPEPIFHAPSYAIVGDNIRLDGSQSNDADGIITRYLWDLGDGTTKIGSIISYAYRESGEYDLGLSVTDNRASTITATKTITIYAVDSYEIVSRPGSSRTVFTGQRVLFDGTRSSSMGGDITQFLWNLGDTIDFGEKVSHIYRTPGVYNVSLLITDQRMNTDLKTIQITVIAPPITPSVREEKQITDSTSTFTSSDLGSKVTISSSGETSILFMDYPHNPHPSKPLPVNSVGTVKDISFSNPDNIQWPIHVEIKVNSSFDPSIATRLGLYWFNGSSWILCENTGYNHSNNSVWALMSREETSGSPIIPAVAPSPADIIVTELKVGPKIVEIGESVTITIHHANNGDLDGNFSSTIHAADDTIMYSTYTEGHNTSVFTTVYSTLISGNFTINVGSLSEDILVKPPPADLNPTGFIIPEEEIYPNESYTIILNLQNIGGSHAKNFYVTLLVNGTVYGQENVPVLSKQDHIDLIYNFTVSKAGTYNVSCVVDSGSNITELNEQNNIETLRLDVLNKPYNTSLYIILSSILVIIMIIFLRLLNNYTF